MGPIRARLFSYKSFTVCLFTDGDDPAERGKLRTKNGGKDGRANFAGP